MNPGFDKHVEALEDFAFEYADAKLGRERSLDSLLLIVRRLYRVGSSEGEKIWLETERRADRGEGVRIACKEGCDHCCHQPVAATVPEILYLSTAIQGLPSDSVERYLSSANALAPGQGHKNRVACPILRDGRCSAYDFRPFSCRGFNSVDVANCITLKGLNDRAFIVYANIPYTLPSQALRKGLQFALRKHGMFWEYVDLVRALKLCQKHSDAGDRYLGGESLFEAACTNRL